MTRKNNTIRNIIIIIIIVIILLQVTGNIDVFSIFNPKGTTFTAVPFDNLPTGFSGVGGGGIR